MPFNGAELLVEVAHMFNGFALHGNHLANLITPLFCLSQRNFLPPSNYWLLFSCILYGDMICVVGGANSTSDSCSEQAKTNKHLFWKHMKALQTSSAPYLGPFLLPTSLTHTYKPAGGIRQSVCFEFIRRTNAKNKHV